MLSYNGATLSDDILAMLVKEAEELSVPPSYLIVKLHYEGLWGSSAVAKTDNNLSGMTWTGAGNRPSGVKVTRGSARPANEGGYYMHYSTLEDFFKDWLYLIRRGGIYNIADSNTFDEAVKGMFRVGGAKYDYATSNLPDYMSKERYENYLKGMRARRQAINEANDGALDRLDKGDDIMAANASAVINEAKRWLGSTKWSAGHKQIIDGYNAVRPLPMGYAVTYNDDWCDTFVSFVGIKAGASDLIGRECGVERHKNIFRQKGIWLGLARPQAGDIVTFNWSGNRGGWGDHIGIVVGVSGDQVTTIEGNTTVNGQSTVAYRQYPWNSSYIQGYARPRYAGGGSQSPVPPSNGKKVTIASYATHWQTGERIADFVKGKTYNVVNERSVMQSRSRKAYCLHDGKTYLGWLLEQDVVGFKSYKSDTEVAKEVLEGKWKNNPERIKLLSQAGYDPQKVQAEVNRLIKEKGSEKPQETIKPAPIEKQQIGGDKIKLADNEVLLDGVVYVVKKKE